MSRPKLDEKISPDDFAGFYWLKQELTDFCRTMGIKSAGGKVEVAARISMFLVTGRITEKTTAKKTISKFDWNRALLSPDTILTDNY